MASFSCADTDSPSDDLIQAWRHHLVCEFAASDALFAELCLSHPDSSEVRLEWGRSFRCRGQFDAARTLFDRSLEIAQSHARRDLLPQIYLESAICFRQMADRDGHGRAVQLAIQAVLIDSDTATLPDDLLREWERFTSGAIPDVAKDWDADDSLESLPLPAQNLGRLSGRLVAEEWDSMSCQAEAFVRRTPDSGDFYTTLLRMKQSALKRLRERDWRGGLRLIEEAESRARQLGLTSLALDCARWKARLRKALRLMLATPEWN